MTSEQLPSEFQLTESQERRAAELVQLLASTQHGPMYLPRQIIYLRDRVRALQAEPDTYVEGFKDALGSAAITCARCATLERRIAELEKDVARLDSKTIIVSGWDELGQPQLVHHVGIDLRAAIDAAMEQKS